MINKNQIRKQINELLQLANVNESPVPVEKIARLYGAHIRYEPLEGDISGFIYRENETTIIGVNSSHSPTRQRFTIAHELGHMQLHSDNELHIDRVFVHMRNEKSSQAVDIKEIEANLFAAELLMPIEMVISDWRQREMPLSYDYEDDKFIAKMAKSYKVSLQAMIFRLMNLNLIAQQ
jgi:Zn-dependent peptidase ImmA (M78 family)